MKDKQENNMNKATTQQGNDDATQLKLGGKTNKKRQIFFAVRNYGAPLCEEVHESLSLPILMCHIDPTFLWYKSPEF